ncbi:MAG TPA: SulP family inorganic anion transporter [Pseudolabrys sp.]|nr:SulP family inorganic anion transporter [Pseudolabrys sp.]
MMGGLVSSALAIPLALGFGMFVFVSLGDQYFAHGAIAGLISAFVAGSICLLLGDRSGTIYAPRITTTFFLGLLLVSLVHSPAPELKSEPASFKLMVLFAIIILAGIFQALFGLLRLGTLIKFAPFPVMAGFQNMAAVLLFLVQIGNVLGYDHNVPFTKAYGEIATAKPLSVLVAAATFAAAWHARRITTKAPPLLVGLGVGILIYYGFVEARLSSALGPTIGLPSAAITMPRPYRDFLDPILLSHLFDLAGIIVPGALALAIIAAIDAMLCAKLAARPGDQRRDSNHMLIRLGLGNAATAAAGGITAGINIGPTTANRTFGGRTWISIAVNAAALLLTILFLVPLVTHLPRAVISALIMVVAIQHIDPWSKQAAIRLLSGRTTQRAALALDLSVALVVSILSITVNIVLAVFLGLGIAILLFVVRMSGTNIRRRYRCNTYRSRKARAVDELELLERHGRSILVIELQGALFFGSAERLARQIDAEMAQPTRWIVLDLRRITEIDSTGVRILADIEADLRRRNAKLTLVLRDGSEMAQRLADLPAMRSHDVDRAIEKAEDDLLSAMLNAAITPAGELQFEQVSLLRDFSADQIARLGAYVQRMEWPRDSTIFKEGDPGSHMFLVTRGRASVRLLSDDRNVRLATFAPGSVFGELALLDKGPRSATITADEDMTTWALSEKSFGALQTQHPDIAIQILSALGHELSRRLRQANLTIHQLEE